MAQAAYIVAGLAVVGALASWIVGAVFYVKTLRAISQTEPRALLIQAIVAWPFTLGRLRGDAAATAVTVNKALIAFFVCMMVAISAISVATNLARVSR
jgi:hypothetical protein